MVMDSPISEGPVRAAAMLTHTDVTPKTQVKPCAGVRATNELKYCVIVSFESEP